MNYSDRLFANAAGTFGTLLYRLSARGLGTPLASSAFPENGTASIDWERECSSYTERGGAEEKDL